MKTKNPCPLCKSVTTDYYLHAMERDYYSCKDCDLIFVSNEFLLDTNEEKKRYDFHENSIDNIGYRKFLQQAVNPILELVPQKSKGLDYGSGPHPVLATLLEIEGYKMNFYDPYYADNKEVLNEKYDFITCTETAEHFYNPKIEFDKLFSLLNSYGCLLIMTSFTDDVEDFSDWHYQKDETHVCFYSINSMRYIAKMYKAKLTIIDRKLAIFYT